MLSCCEKPRSMSYIHTPSRNLPVWYNPYPFVPTRPGFLSAVYTEPTSRTLLPRCRLQLHDVISEELSVALYDLPLNPLIQRSTLYRRSSFSLIRLKNRWTLMGNWTHSSKASRYSGNPSCCNAYASSLRSSVAPTYVESAERELPAKALWMRSRISWATGWSLWMESPGWLYGTLEIL